MLSSRSGVLILGRIGNTSQQSCRSLTIASNSGLGASSNLRISRPGVSKALTAVRFPVRRLGTRTPSSTLPRRNHRRHYTTLPAKQSFVEDTIYAVSTAQGRAGIAIIRISGPACLDIYRSLCPSKAPLKPRYATVRTLIDSHAQDGLNILDSDAIVIHFPGPKTVTGEDVLELHIHGGPATIKAVLAAIPKCAAGVRYAEPGEFTRRAFINDRLDLAQVESLADTLSADTEQQRRAAVRGNSGALGRTYESWRSQLLLARGEIEALIDFSEDQHFDESPAELLRNVTAMVDEMLRSIRNHEAASARGELLRSGIRIALVGPPNVGKSSLMNLIVGREASIVSVEAGTTRDIVEVSLDIRGYLCSFADTAGFRGGCGAEPIGIVEEEGIRRAKQKALESDVVVVLGAVEPNPQGGFSIEYDKETLEIAAQAQESFLVVNKRDAVDETLFSTLVDDFRATVRAQAPALEKTKVMPISCKDAQLGSSVDSGGVHALIDELAGSFAGMTSLPADMQDLLGVTERQRQLLEQCRNWLEEYTKVTQPSEQAEEEPDIVLAAEYLRYAADCLAKITGRGESGDVEEVLGVIFEKFCVGK
ncbi:hypothetical protein ACRALDRAFT_1073471 [Sodiomyces alcalophilus JCM 7366]|uniref:uncharacterized protein n=1 Tax=Sodiomyces alcalophilus JCM 7366 TaxID=591952 RepID=UPI0039B6454D